MDNSTMPQLDIFDIDKWNKLSRSEREDQFQQLEDYYADAEKRPRIKLEFGKVPSGANAQFTPGKKRMSRGRFI